MTAIVGLVDGSTVYIGGDSAGVSGLSLIVRADAKVFTLGADGYTAVGCGSEIALGALFHGQRQRRQWR